MKKRCNISNSAICIENFYVLFLLILVIGLYLHMYLQHSHYNSHPTINNNIPKIIVKEHHPLHNNGPFNIPTNFPSVPLQGDVLLNPYHPPLRDNRYLRSLYSDIVLPINVPTQSIDTSYRQVGILTRGDTILPLMGKPLFTNRDKWNFYTMNDKNNMIKLPLSNRGRSCTNEYGCDNIYNGDTVYVEGYNDSFKATVYDNQVMQYIPFI